MKFRAGDPKRALISAQVVISAQAVIFVQAVISTQAVISAQAIISSQAPPQQESHSDLRQHVYNRTGYLRRPLAQATLQKLRGLVECVVPHSFPSMLLARVWATASVGFSTL